MRKKHNSKQKTALCIVGLFFITQPVLICAEDNGTDEYFSTLETSADAARDMDEVQLREPFLTLEAVLAYAQDRNPTIRAVHDRWVAAQERPTQVSALDDPTFTYEGFNLPEHFNIARTDNNIIKLSQKLPFPGKRWLRSKIAMHEADIAKEEARMAEVITRAEVKKSYYDLWLVQQNLRIYSRNKELMAQFATIAEKKYAVGQAAQPDVLRAQMELTRLVARMTTETLKVEEVKARLNKLLSRPPDAPLGIPEGAPKPTMKQTLAELAELALQTRPEITTRTVAIHRDTSALALAQKAYLPDFEVVAERFFNGGRKDGFGFIFSATIPLAYREKYDAGVVEARAQLAADKAELRAARDSTLAEVKGALVRAQTAVELVNLFSQTHIPQSEQTLASSRIGYQTGNVDFLSLVDSLRSVEQVHLEYLAAAADFEKAHAELEQAVGQELPRIE